MRRADVVLGASIIFTGSVITWVYREKQREEERLAAGILREQAILKEQAEERKRQNLEEYLNQQKLYEKLKQEMVSAEEQK